MQVRIEDVSPVEKKLIVEVPWSTVSDKLASAYRELGKSVQVRGFRKGKVPRSVLQRMYGRHVRAEVTTQLVRESFVAAATEHNLSPVSEPRLAADELDIKSGQPLAFEAIIEVKGDVVAKDYDGLELRRRRLNVPDEEVDKAIEALRREHTELLPIEGRDVTARTDVVSVKLAGTVGDEPVDQPGMAIDLSAPENEPFPGLVDRLIGLPVNVEDHEVEIVVPEDHEEPGVAGKTARLRISILDARQKEVPALDDEFAKDLDRGETLDELRQGVRADLEKRQEEEIRRELREAALKALIKKNEIPVAGSLVERGIEFQYQQMQAMLGMWGMQQGTMALDDEMRERLRPSALDTVRGELLLEALAQQESVEITEEDVQERVARLGRSRGVPAARLRAELERDGELDNIRYQLRRDKLLDLLVERATVTEVDAAELAAAEKAEADQAEAGSPAADEGEGASKEAPEAASPTQEPGSE